MIDWPVVAAFIGPLIATIGIAVGWVTWSAQRREKRIGDQISLAISKLEGNQLLMQERISQVETAMTNQSHHLDKQDEALVGALTAIARIEGRLSQFVIPAREGT